MKKDDLGGTRVVKLRELLNFSQQDFAEKVGITQGALSQIESGKSQASFDTLRKISDEFNVNCNWLIRGLGEVLIETARARRDIRTAEKASIPLIKEEAHAGYVKRWQDKEYINQLDVYQIPGFEKGDYRLFEIIGDSMMPSLHPGEIVVCEFARDWTKIENATLGVLITKEGILAKRIHLYPDQTDSIILKSDNQNYKTYSLPRADVGEIWTIKAKITSRFVTSNDFDYKRMEKLETDLNLLKSQVSNLLNKDGAL